MGTIINSKTNKIEDGWESCLLNEVGFFSKGKGIKKDEAKDVGLPCIRYGEIYTDYKEVAFETFSFVDPKVAKESKQIKTGDILFAGSGETAEEIGKTVVYMGSKAAYAGGDTVILTPYKDDPVFLGYLLNTKSVAFQKAQVAQGDAVVHIYPSQLGKISITKPKSKEEQIAIGASLSDIDKLIIGLRKLIIKKKNITTGVMAELLTGKKRLPGRTSKWVKKNLCDIGYFQAGNGFPVKYQGDKDGRYPFFKVSDMNNLGNEIYMASSNNYISEKTRKKIGAKILPKHSILFAKIGAAIFLERKKITISESCVDNNMMGFIVDKDLGNYKFIHFLLLTVELGKLVSASALPALNGTDLGKMSFLLPDAEEQAEIAVKIDDFYTEINILNAKLNKLLSFKQGVMQQLLTGKIRLK